MKPITVGIELTNTYQTCYPGFTPLKPALPIQNFLLQLVTRPDSLSTSFDSCLSCPNGHLEFEKFQNPLFYNILSNPFEPSSRL